MKQIRKRVMADTPAFFRQLRNGALLVTGITTAILSAPVCLPALVTTIAGYLFIAGAVATAISQLTTEPDDAAIPRIRDIKKGGRDEPGIEQ